MYNVANLTRIKDRIVDISKATSRFEFGSLRKSIRGYVFPQKGIEFHELAYGGSKGKGRPVGYKGKYRGSEVRPSYGMNSLLEENVRKLVNTNPEIKWKIIREDPRSGKQWVITYDGNGRQPDDASTSARDLSRLRNKPETKELAPTRRNTLQDLIIQRRKRDEKKREADGQGTNATNK